MEKKYKASKYIKSSLSSIVHLLKYDFKSIKCKKGAIRYTYKVRSKSFLVNKVFCDILNIMINDVIENNIEYYIKTKSLIFTYHSLREPDIRWVKEHVKRIYNNREQNTKVFIFRLLRRKRKNISVCFPKKEIFNYLQTIDHKEYPTTKSIMTLLPTLCNLYPDLEKNSLELILNMFAFCIRNSILNKDTILFSNKIILQHYKNHDDKKVGYYEYFNTLRKLARLWKN